ncbi:hypothetical protein D9M72_591330 [compost metagenome]
MSCLITMSQKELHRLEVIQKIRDQRLSVVQAAELLGLRRSQVHRLLQAPFDCGPDRLYLLLASRSAPGLLLGRLRASCDLPEIECADLRFDFHESLSFLKDNLDATIDADGAH